MLSSKERAYDLALYLYRLDSAHGTPERDGTKAVDGWWRAAIEAGDTSMVELLGDTDRDELAAAWDQVVFDLTKPAKKSWESESEYQVRLEAYAALTKHYGQVWDTETLQQDYSVESFLAPIVFVTRKSDGVRGSLKFCHNPRFYFDFAPEVKR